MSTSDYCKIGFVSKPKGLKGVLRVSFEDFFVAYLSENPVNHIFVGRRGQLAPFFVENIEGLETHNIGIKFEDIDSMQAASRLQNSSLYFQESLLKEYIEAEEEEEWAYLVDYTLVNQEGVRIGIIEGIVYLPQHELIQLTYQNREVLLPIHEDIILGIDEETGILKMELPQGILEL